MPDVRAGVERTLAVLAWSAVLLPLWTWWFARTVETLDAGMVAWGALAWFLVDAWRRNGWRAVEPSAKAYLIAASGLAAFCALRPFLPITLCGVFGVVGGLPLLLPRTHDQGELPTPLAGLAVAGLPSLLILDLFLGVPLRWVSTVAATALLRLTGLAVVRNGMEIAVGGVPVWVDAPCAGVKMLGTGVVLALVLAQIGRLRFWRTVNVCALAVVAVCAANAARVAVLTVLAAAGHPMDGWAHEVVGCLALLLALLIVALVPCLGKVRKNDSVGLATPAGNTKLRFTAMAVFVVAAMVCIGWHPSSVREDDTAKGVESFPGWPKTFDGETLVEESQNELEQVFAKDFPGRIGRFRAGGRQVILRWTTHATHRVHGSVYCLRAAGWNIEPYPQDRGDDGVWSVFRATRASDSLTVREQVRCADGTNFPDVPTWFFHAILGRSHGPWWIVTVADAATRL